MQIYDISQTLSPGIAIWPGDPEFGCRWAMKIEDGHYSNVSAIEMCVHTGTHLDAPLHLNDSGNDIASVPLRHLVGPVRVFSVSEEKCIRSADLALLNWEKVERVLFKTRSRYSPENVFDPDFIYLCEDAAEFLIRKGVLLVGIDAPSVDAFDNASLPSHRKLLQNKIAILENVRLDHVLPGDYELVCLPLKLAGLEASPVRAILRK